MDTTFNPRLVRVGDEIRFDGRGPRFTVYGPDANDDGVVDSATLDIAYAIPSTVIPFDYPTMPLPINFPWENGVVNNLPSPPGVTYQVFRQPVRSTTAPLQLPDSIVVDLAASGPGNKTFMHSSSFAGGSTGSVPAAGRWFLSIRS